MNRVHLTEFTKELCVVFFPPPFNLSLLVPSHRKTSALFSHTVHPRDSKDWVVKLALKVSRCLLNGLLSWTVECRGLSSHKKTWSETCRVRTVLLQWEREPHIWPCCSGGKETGAHFSLNMLGSPFPLCPLYLGNLCLGPLLITQILFKSFFGLGITSVLLLSLKQEDYHEFTVDYRMRACLRKTKPQVNKNKFFLRTILPRLCPVFYPLWKIRWGLMVFRPFTRLMLLSKQKSHQGAE